MCHPCSTHNPQNPYLTYKRDQIAQYIHEQIPHTRSFYWDFDVMRRVTGDPWPFHACQQGSVPSTTSHHLEAVSNLLQWAWGTWRGSIWYLHKMRLYLVTLGSSTGWVLSSSQHEGDNLSVLSYHNLRTLYYSMHGTGTTRCWVQAKENGPKRH